MKKLKIGIASYEEMKMRTLAVARGEIRPTTDSPKIWFTSTESFAKVLSAGNREMLRVIAEQKPRSIEELAQLTGRQKSNLSRTLKTMAGHGLVTLKAGEKGRIAPAVTHESITLDLPLVGYSSGTKSRAQSHAKGRKKNIA